VSLDPNRRGSLAVNAYVVGLIWVSEYKIFGANYSVQAFPAFTDNVLEVPILKVDEGSSIGFADLCFQPINLGWHTARADFIAGLGVYAPTGRYEADGDENPGPELTIPIATKKKLIGFLNARYLWETGARSTLEGNTFVFTATFPIPSVPLE